MSKIIIIILYWVATGGILFVFTIIELFHRTKDSWGNFSWGYFKEVMLTKFIYRAFNILVSYVWLGPFAVIPSMFFSRALQLFNDYKNAEVESDIYGVGKLHNLDIESSFSKKPKVWVKFYTYPDPILISYINLIIIDHEKN